jgi:4-hydroxy-tetrahydrodipicolinate synthase
MAIFNGMGITREPACAVMGSRGFVSGMASLMPQANVDIYLAHKAGDYAKARKLRQKLAPLTDLLAGGKGGLDNIARLKAAMRIAGIPAGPARPPAIPPDEETKAQLKQVFETI